MTEEEEKEHEAIFANLDIFVISRLARAIDSIIRKDYKTAKGLLITAFDDFKAKHPEECSKVELVLTEE